MIEEKRPKRYSLAKNMEEAPYGPWVKYSDYEQLQADRREFAELLLVTIEAFETVFPGIVKEARRNLTTKNRDNFDRIVGAAQALLKDEAKRNEI